MKSTKQLSSSLFILGIVALLVVGTFIVSGNSISADVIPGGTLNDGAVTTKKITTTTDSQSKCRSVPTPKPEPEGSFSSDNSPSQEEKTWWQKLKDLLFASTQTESAVAQTQEKCWLFTGRATDFDSEQPIANLKIVLAVSIKEGAYDNAPEIVVAQTKTGEDGRFTIDRLPPSSQIDYDLYISGNDYIPYRESGINAIAPEEVDLEENMEDFPMEKGADTYMYGIVTDKTNKPLPEARIFLKYENPEDEDDTQDYDIKVDANGRFDFGPLKQVQYTAFIDAGEALEELEIILYPSPHSEGKKSEHRIILDDPPYIFGTVKDIETGRAIVGASVKVLRVEENVLVEEESRRYRIKTDQEGKFKTGKLQKKLYGLEIESNSYGLEVKRNITPAATNSESNKADIKLSKLDSFIFGTLTDSKTGKAITERVEISFTDQTSEEFSDADTKAYSPDEVKKGLFRSQELVTRPHKVSIQAPGYKTYTKDNVLPAKVQGATNTLDVKLEYVGSGVIYGKVVEDFTHTPFRGASVKFESMDGKETYTTRVKDDGTYKSPSLNKIPFKVTSEGFREYIGQSKDNITPQEKEEESNKADFFMKTGVVGSLTIEGLAIDPGNNNSTSKKIPLYVAVITPGRIISITTPFDQQIPEGNYSVMFRPADNPNWKLIDKDTLDQQVEIEEGRSATIEFVVEPKKIENGHFIVRMMKSLEERPQPTQCVLSGCSTYGSPIKDLSALLAGQGKVKTKLFPDNAPLTIYTIPPSITTGFDVTVALDDTKDRITPKRILEFKGLAKANLLRTRAEYTNIRNNSQLTPAGDGYDVESIARGKAAFCVVSNGSNRYVRVESVSARLNGVLSVPQVSSEPFGEIRWADPSGYIYNFAHAQTRSVPSLKDCLK